jgi:hypothetical protein
VTPAMPALRKLRQENCKFHASLGYIEKPSQHPPLKKYSERQPEKLEKVFKLSNEGLIY